eukprot:2433167-Pleurochrysis_carterae.AAC.1
MAADLQRGRARISNNGGGAIAKHREAMHANGSIRKKWGVTRRALLSRKGFADDDEGICT